MVGLCPLSHQQLITKGWRNAGSAIKKLKVLGGTPLEVRQEALSCDMPAEYPILENKRINKYKEKWCA